MNWPEFFFSLAELTSKKSKDRSTKCGAVIVGPDNEVRSLGYNGFPRGVDDDVEERHQRPDKYLWTEHAERNAIYNAARAGICLKGCALYLQWQPCSDCARAIIQSGITKVYCLYREKTVADPVWQKTLAVGQLMLLEAGVEYILVYPKNE